MSRPPRARSRLQRGSRDATFSVGRRTSAGRPRGYNSSRPYLTIWMSVPGQIAASDNDRSQEAVADAPRRRRAVQISCGW